MTIMYPNTGRSARVLRSMNAKALCRAIVCSMGAVTLAVLTLAPSDAFAQSAPGTLVSGDANATAADTKSLQEIVVTGVAISSGVKKLDASFSITTMSLEEIRDINPSSAADLLKAVPGIWPETSGGVTGANIDIAGFPGGGDAPFVTYQINGSPIFPANLSFMDNSSLFRLDESVERAEVVQGGPSTVTSNGQLGAIANFILRQGTETPHGDIGVTGGTGGLYRVDGFYGGPLGQDWYASIGGFYRYSTGIRDSQFPSDNGGQLTATVSHRMDDGSVVFYARALNDKNMFITDIPVTVTGTGSSTSISAFPGFNPNTGTFAGNGLRSISVQEAPGAPPLTGDLADGRGSNLHMFGSDLDLSISDGISVSNKLMYSAGEIDCYCLFNNLAPQTLSSFISGEIDTVNANTAITGPYGKATTGSATLVSTGAVINPNSYVASLGFWIVQKQIQSFTDELRFTFKLAPGNNLTVGGYLGAYSSNDHWWLGNNELVTATPHAQLIDLTLNNGANVTNSAGLLGASFYTLVENWTGLNTALFASDQWRLGSLLLDAGYRIETQKDNGSIENTSSVNLDNNPLNLYNKNVSVPNGTFNQGVDCDTSAPFAGCTQYRHTHGSGTVGANYELTSQMAVFARASQGIHFPGFDDLRGGAPQSISVRNYEVGYREQSATTYAMAEVFYRKFTGAAYQAFITLPPGAPAGTLPYIDASFGAKSYGLEFQGRWEPIPRLTLDLSGDVIHAVYTNYDNGSGTSYTGSTLVRQPHLQLRFTPAYDVPMAWGSLRFFTTYSYAGLAYSVPGDQQVLPAYYTLEAGVVATIAQNFEVRVQGTNLTNQIGLTEGNARVGPGLSGISTNFEMARPIFGREINVQLRYKF